jgi:hypothetical protein
VKIIKLKAGDNETLQWTASALSSISGWLGKVVYCEYRGIMLAAHPEDTPETIERRYVTAKTCLDKDLYTRA